MLFYGGKSSINTRGLGKWIVGLLPDDEDVTYVETHGGMLGCLLGRPPASREIANDLNPRIVNWWEVVRDRAGEFQALLRYTPHSEELYNEARSSLDEGDALRRALNLHVVVTFSALHGDGEAGVFGVNYTVDGGGIARSAATSMERVPKVAGRLQEVEFRNQPAWELLEELETERGAVIYVDPPYRSANSTEPYGVVQHDYEDTLATLRRQSGRVAVSGYNDDWDELGWERHEYQTHGMRLDGFSKRTEVLWTNYEPQPSQQASLID